MKSLFFARFSQMAGWCLLSFSLAFSQVAQADESETTLIQRYPAGSINSVKQASTAQGETKEARILVEKDYADARRACYDTFFASSCLKDAREQRRIRIEPIRRIEVEAAAFLRKEKAAERDRAVAERERKAMQPRSAPDLSISGASRNPAPAQSDPEEK
jgi:hypothetical protein